MEFNWSQSQVIGGVITFPDYAYVPPPKQASQLKESMILTGSSRSTSQSITATADQSES